MPPSPKKVAKEEHHPAVPVARLGAFLKALAQVSGIGPKARFATLTAARSGEVRGATWSKFDFEAKLWTVAPVRMKGGVEHRVLLSSAALKLVLAQPRIVLTLRRHKTLLGWKESLMEAVQTQLAGCQLANGTGRHHPGDMPEYPELVLRTNEDGRLAAGRERDGE